MKKVMMVLLTLIVIGATVTINGCEKLGHYECVTTTTCNTSVKTCSNGIQTYYEANGKRYDCNGTDCNDAAEDLVDDICDFKCSDKNEKVEYLITISKLQSK